MKFTHYYEDNHLFIAEMTWTELKKDKSSVAFHGVVAAAKETINRNGAFIVYRESDSAIMRKCDRRSELENEIS